MAHRVQRASELMAGNSAQDKRVQELTHRQLQLELQQHEDCLKLDKLQLLRERDQAVEQARLQPPGLEYVSSQFIAEAMHCLQAAAALSGIDMTRRNLEEKQQHIEVRPACNSCPGHAADPQLTRLPAAGAAPDGEGPRDSPARPAAGPGPPARHHTGQPQQGVPAHQQAAAHSASPAALRSLSNSQVAHS